MADTEAAAAPAVPATMTYRLWMVAAAEEYERVGRLLRGLTAEQWVQPTDCDGWTVRDVAAHLAGAAAATASIRELARQARRARRLGSHGDLVDRMNQVQVDERTELSPDELVADLDVNAKRGLAARRRLPAPVRAVRVPFGPPLGVRPLGYLMGRIYTRDVWMHRVDLARATGAELLLTKEHDGAIIEDLVAEWAASHRAACDVELSGPAGGKWRSESKGEAAPVELDAVEFGRILSGRAPAAGLLAHRVPF